MSTLTRAAKSWKAAADKERTQRETRDWAIKHAIQSGESVSHVAEVTGLTRQAIYNIINREV
jgi:Mor family transcriptional regulator